MRVLVATIGKPFGLRGEVTLRVLTDEPEARLAVGQVLYPEESSDAGMTVTSLRVEPPGGVLGLAASTDRGQAEALRGTELWAEVDASARPGARGPGRSDSQVTDEAQQGRGADPDEWYDYQLIGLPCVSPDGVALGDVVDVLHLPAHECLLVRSDLGDVMVPFVSAIVPEVTVERVTIDDPGGLFPSDDGAAAGEDLGTEEAT